MRKDALVGRQHGAQALGRELINLHPLDEDAVFLQAAASQLEEFLCEEIGDARNPGMARFADDHVILRRVDAQVCARVVNNQAQARVFERLVINVIEILSRPQSPSAQARRIRAI